MGVLDREFLGMGAEVKQFEEMLTEFFGRPTLCVSTGTAALHLALQAIGIGVGISLSNKIPLIFMQNAGFANSISTITSLVQLYEIPVIFLIGWRGYLKNDAPEHTKIGNIQPKLLQTIGLESKVVTDLNWKKSVKWAIQKTKKSSCALIIRREFND